MKTIKVTPKEKQVLESLAKNMYAELGFSDVGFPELRKDTGLTNKVLRGVVSSLIKKDFIDIDDRRDEMDVDHRNVDMHIIYLTSKTRGLVPHWAEEEGIEPLTAQQLSDATYFKLVSLNYARKANYFTEANPTMFSDLNDDLKDAILSFPKIYIDPREDLMGVDSLDGNQQFYLIENENGFYLVDTQGYNYPRYITRLTEFEYSSEMDAFDYMDGMIKIANDQIFNSVIRNLVGDLMEEGEFHKSDILNFLQWKLDMAFEAATKKQ